MNVLLRRTPRQTASRHSDSLPVQELSFGLPMTLSATSNGDFPHNVVGRLSCLPNSKIDLVKERNSPQFEHHRAIGRHSINRGTALNFLKAAARDFTNILPRSNSGTRK